MHQRLQGRSRDAENERVGTGVGSGMDCEGALADARHRAWDRQLGDQRTAQEAGRGALGDLTRVGMRAGGTGQEGGDMCAQTADSRCHTAETNTTLPSNYTPI